MRNLIFLFLIQLTFYSYSQNDATKKETVDWLTSRLNYIANWDEKDYQELKVVKYDFQNDTIFYKVHYIYEGKPHSIYRIDAIPIRDINPGRIKIVKMFPPEEGNMGIELYVNNGEKNIQSYHYKIDNTFTMTLHDSKVTLIFPKSVISREGIEITERTKKAIEHLIKLTGGKGEKF